MEQNRIEFLRQIANEQAERAKEYADARRKAGLSKTKLDLLLTAALPTIRIQKPNVGVEMAVLILMEDNDVARGLYRDWQIEESTYKGLEKLLEAHATRISLEQSIFKYKREGEKYGV